MVKDRAEIIRGEKFTSHLRKHGKSDLAKIL